MNGVPLNIDFHQILLHLLNVVILFAIIYFLIYKPVKNFMDKRQQEYRDMEKDAADKVQEAQDLKASYEQKLQGAEEEIRSLRAQASREAAEHAHSMEESAREEARRIVEQARAKAENEKEKILGSTGDQITKLARDAASKAIFEDPSEAYDSFLKAAEGK